MGSIWQSFHFIVVSGRVFDVSFQRGTPFTPSDGTPRFAKNQLTGVPQRLFWAIFAVNWLVFHHSCSRTSHFLKKLPAKFSPPNVLLLRFTEISGTFFAGMQACKYSRICKFSAVAGSHTCRNWGETTSKSNPPTAENRVSLERGKIFGWPTIRKKLHFFRRWAWYTKSTVVEFLSLCSLGSSFLF